MLANIGVPGLVLILVIALIIFGPNKLPELGRAVGRTLGEFKSATKSLSDDDDYVEPKRQQTAKKEEVVVKSTEESTSDEQKL